MPSRLSIGSIGLTTGAKRKAPAIQRESDAPFRMLLMADFSAAPMPRTALGKPMRVDLDNMDHVCSRFAAKLQLQAGDQRVVIEPRSLNDLHPDGLFQLRWFDDLRELRARLADPKNF